jgi:hypothetical protein
MANFDNNVIIRVLLVVLAAFILFAFINYYNSKSKSSFVNGKASNNKDNKHKQHHEQFKSSSTFSNIERAATTGAGIYQSVKAAKEANNARKQKFEQFTQQDPSSVNPSEEMGDELYRTVDFESQKLPGDCFPKDRLTSDDLLPKDAANSKWSQVATNGQGELANQNFLTSGYHVGINSVSGSLRNANLQLRSDPPNPKLNVGPWNTSTITNNGIYNRPFEIGGDC